LLEEASGAGADSALGDGSGASDSGIHGPPVFARRGECMFGSLVQATLGLREVMPMDDERPQLHELAYNEGLRALGDQTRTLDQIRVRVAGVLGTSTTASAFLVGIVAKAADDRQDCWYWLGVVLGASLYAVVLGLSLSVLRPRYEWRFNVSPQVIIDGYADTTPPATLSETHRLLAEAYDRNIQHNQINLYLMQQRLTQAMGAMVAELACWACLLAKVA
jgi:hypothetical protein